MLDVDPRNSGDIEKVRALLDELKVRVFAEVATPSDGRHFSPASSAADWLRTGGCGAAQLQGATVISQTRA